MDLKQAIDHCKEVVTTREDLCSSCIEEHTDLLKFLEELQIRREMDTTHHDIVTADGTLISKGQTYRHFKGKKYIIVVPCVLNTNDLKLYVIYRGTDNARRMWSRPIEEFISPLPPNTKDSVNLHLRFELMEGE